jgi:hypothetical protein
MLFQRSRDCYNVSLLRDSSCVGYVDKAIGKKKVWRDVFHMFAMVSYGNLGKESRGSIVVGFPYLPLGSLNGDPWASCYTYLGDNDAGVSVPMNTYHPA